jgi:hypothetical protein
MALSTIFDRRSSVGVSSAMANPSLLLASRRGAPGRRARTSERMVGRR